VWFIELVIGLLQDQQPNSMQNREIAQHTEEEGGEVEGVKVDIAGALVSPLGSAPRLLDRRRCRAMFVFSRSATDDQNLDWVWTALVSGGRIFNRDIQGKIRQ
jgi:hypothetical protein